jgi:hypothetical protein
VSVVVTPGIAVDAVIDTDIVLVIAVWVTMIRLRY